jgi:hypothetical protein
MIKVTNILSEILNTYQIEAVIISDKKTNISSIFDEIRALNKVTIVTNITPGDYKQTKPNVEVHKVKIKFVTREDPKEDIIQLKKDMLTSDLTSDSKRLKI